MLRFYDVDVDYVRFLKKYDNQIPNISYTSNNKFVCGVVLNISGVNYYAPISSFTKQQKTNMLIYSQKGRALSSIRFCFMFPAPDQALTYKDIHAIRLSDPNYANLLQEEYRFCVKHEAEILAAAKKVYKIGCNPNHVLNYSCCKFQKLEEVMPQWSK